MEMPGRWPDVRAELEARVEQRGCRDAARQLVGPRSRSPPRRWNRPTPVVSCAPWRCTLGSGRPFSSFGPGVDTYRPIRFAQFGLRWPRPLLARRIAERVQRMIDEGLLAEVESLAHGPDLANGPAGARLQGAVRPPRRWLHARRGGRDDHHPHPPVRRAPGAVVPTRPAHTLDRHRRRPGGHRAAGTGKCMARARTDEAPRSGQRLPGRLPPARRGPARAGPAAVRPASRHRRRRSAGRRERGRVTRRGWCCSTPTARVRR